MVIRTISFRNVKKINRLFGYCDYHVEKIILIYSSSINQAINFLSFIKTISLETLSKRHNVINNYCILILG